MNESLTIALNNLSGIAIWFDYLVIFCARFLPWVVGVIFFVDIISHHHRNIRPFLYSVVGLLFTVGATGILKALFAEERPFQALNTIHPLFTYTDLGSFPSGHTFFFTSLTTLAFAAHARFFVFYLVSTFLIGLSRVIAGVHYVGDVIWGFVFGLILMISFIMVFKKGSWEND